MHKIALASLLFLTSCQVYRSDFDYCPGRGVSCKSVTEIEKMVIETEKGPDLFVSFDEGKARNVQRRVWIEGRRSECGEFTEGHYLYFRSKN